MVSFTLTFSPGDVTTEICEKSEQRDTKMDGERDHEDRENTKWRKNIWEIQEGNKYTPIRTRQAKKEEESE
jgi:hypothetical protein